MSEAKNIIKSFSLPSLPSSSPPMIAAGLWSREVLSKHSTTSFSVTNPNGIAVVHLEESSHCVINEEPGKFLVELVNRVLPLVSAGVNEKKEARENNE